MKLNVCLKFIKEWEPQTKYYNNNNDIIIIIHYTIPFLYVVIIRLNGWQGWKEAWVVTRWGKVLISRQGRQRGRCGAFSCVLRCFVALLQHVYSAAHGYMNTHSQLRAQSPWTRVQSGFRFPNSENYFAPRCWLVARCQLRISQKSQPTALAENHSNINIVHIKKW